MPAAGAALAGRNAAMAEELSLLIDGATGYAIYMLDPQGRVTIWNLGAERLNGWAEAEAIGQDFAIFYPPEDAAAGKPKTDLARVSASGRIEEESWQLRKDGSEFLASVTITALRDEAGVLRGFGKVVRDVTDETAVNAALMRRERHLRSILASVPDAMVVFDNDGVVSSFSAAAELMFGYTEGEVIGHHIGLLVPDARDSPGIPGGRIVAEADVEPVDDDPGPQLAVRKDGATFPIELSVGEASLAGERIFTAFVRDLTTRRATERRLKDLQSELVHVSRVSAMGTLASTLAHEINQPLTAIANYLETTRALIGDSDTPLLMTIAQALELGAAQSLRAGNIIRRLRAFVDGGDTGFRVERLDTLVGEATTLGLLGAHEAGIRVTITIAAGQAHVVVDRVQIQQVLVNLIRNAIHSMETSSCKELTIATAPDRDGWMRVTVADTGAGIDADVRERLFDAFATTKEDGMGLGLSICRTIVEAHGGRIWVDVVPTGGAAFHFLVPIPGENDA